MTLLILFVAGGAVTVSTWLLVPKWTGGDSERNNPLQVSADFDNADVPTRIPPLTRLNSVSFARGHEVVRLTEQDGGSDTTVPWQGLPVDSVIEGARLQLVNYEPVPLFHVEVAIRASFQQMIDRGGGRYDGGPVVETRDWSFRISKLEAGGKDPYVLYLVNLDENHPVSIDLTAKGSALRLGESDRREVQLIPLKRTSVNIGSLAFARHLNNSIRGVRRGSPSGVSTPVTPPTKPLSELADEIRTITVEARLTATLKEGAEIPPASVAFTPIGSGSDGKLVGPGGDFSLDYVSPTVFRRLEGNRIVVVNTFSLPPSSSLVGRPVSSLQALEQVHLPVVTIVYGNALDEYSLGEMAISVNGKSPWYYSWKMPRGKFKSGLVLRFPLRDPANSFKW